MAATEQQELTVELARDLVGATAPQELPLFDSISDAYFSDQARPPARGSGDDMLGFGMTEVATMVTPVALAVMTEVVSFVWSEATKAARAEGGVAVQTMVTDLFARWRKPGATTIRATSPALARAADKPRWSPTGEQLNEIRRIARERARRMKMSAAQADILADAIAGGLATAAT